MVEFCWIYDPPDHYDSGNVGLRKIMINGELVEGQYQTFNEAKKEFLKSIDAQIYELRRLKKEVSASNAKDWLGE